MAMHKYQTSNVSVLDVDFAEMSREQAARTIGALGIRVKDMTVESWAALVDGGERPSEWTDERLSAYCREINEPRIKADLKELFPDSWQNIKD